MMFFDYYFNRKRTEDIRDEFTSHGLLKIQMKAIKFFFFMLSAVSVSSALAASKSDLKALSCAGLGITNGYTTIQYLGDDTVAISSLKYFVTTSDLATIVKAKLNRATGDLTLQLVTKNHNVRLLLKLYSGSNRGDLTSVDGTDVLTCSTVFGSK